MYHLFDVYITHKNTIKDFNLNSFKNTATVRRKITTCMYHC